MKTGRDWDGSCCWGARKSCRRGGSTTRLKHCCALATVNCKQCPLQPVRSSRSASNEQGVGVAFRYNRPLYLVTFPYPPRRLESDARWRAGVRLTLGPLRPLLSMAPRPPFHRTRTVVGAAARARLDKDGSPWRRSHRAFAKAIGQRAKTDAIDAAVIAHFGEATGIVPRPLPDQATQQLADLVARRRQIIDMIGAERQREKRANPRIKKRIGRLFKSLERELSSVDTDIDDAVRGSPAWREKEDLLSSVPSVGPAISRTLIAELPELGSLDRKEIAALVGLAPFARQSGQWRGKSFIGGG